MGGIIILKVEKRNLKMADKDQVRQVKIKTGTLKRNMKDYTSYKNEEDQLQ